MDQKLLGNDAPAIAQEILGYLNFSSGAADPRFLKNLNELFGRVAAVRSAEEPVWRRLGNLLHCELHAIRGTCDAFRRVEQVEAVVGLVFDAALPAYREFHRDLLFQHSDESLFQPFFIGRVCEAVLRQGGPWDQTDRIVPAALRQLNDYVGHRPVAVLRTEQKLQPYDHEWVRPIPLWIRGAGVAIGPYQEIIQAALAILDATAPTLLFEAMFTPEQLDELAVDPRAYDFDHPVNKRPNYLFGQWDLTTLDNSGRSRRFVLQQVALEAMLDRLSHHGDLSREEVLWEEAAVLAGTMMMGSGVSGDRPDAHDSSVTLATLVQRIAVYRDAFYEQLLGNLKGSHAERLKAESLPPAAAVRRGAAALQSVSWRGAAPAVAARPLGAIVRLDGIHGRGPAAGRDRARRVGADVVRDPLPPDHRAPGHRTRSTRRGRRAVLPVQELLHRRSSAARSSIPGTCWDSAANTACFRPWRTASTTIASTSC